MKVRFLKPVQVNWTGNQGDNTLTVSRQGVLTLVTRHLQRAAHKKPLTIYNKNKPATIYNPQNQHLVLL